MAARRRADVGQAAGRWDSLMDFVRDLPATCRRSRRSTSVAPRAAPSWSVSWWSGWRATPIAIDAKGAVGHYMARESTFIPVVEATGVTAENAQMNEENVVEAVEHAVQHAVEHAVWGIFAGSA